MMRTSESSSSARMLVDLRDHPAGLLWEGSSAPHAGEEPPASAGRCGRPGAARCQNSTGSTSAIWRSRWTGRALAARARRRVTPGKDAGRSEGLRSRGRLAACPCFFMFSTAARFLMLFSRGADLLGDASSGHALAGLELWDTSAIAGGERLHAGRAARQAQAAGALGAPPPPPPAGARPSGDRGPRSRAGRRLRVQPRDDAPGLPSRSRRCGRRGGGWRRRMSSVPPQSASVAICLRRSSGMLRRRR